jgi:hypothetical protein
MQETLAPRFDAANPDVTGNDSQVSKTFPSCDNVQFAYARSIRSYFYSRGLNVDNIDSVKLG